MLPVTVALADIRVLDRYKWFDQETRRVRTNRGDAYLDIVPIFGEAFAEVAFKIAKRLCDMNLTDEELSIMLALTMFGTGKHIIHRIISFFSDRPTPEIFYSSFIYLNNHYAIIFRSMPAFQSPKS